MDDTRTSTVVQLRAAGDQPLDVKKKGYALGKAWQIVYSKLQSKNKWFDGYRLGSNPHAGNIYLATDITEAWELITVAEHNGTFTLNPMIDNLKEWGFTEDEAKAIPEAVRSAIAAE